MAEGREFGNADSRAASFSVLARAWGVRAGVPADGCTVGAGQPARGLVAIRHGSVGARLGRSFLGGNQALEFLAQLRELLALEVLLGAAEHVDGVPEGDLAIELL